MRVTFTITKQEAWEHLWRNWPHLSLRLTLRLSALPIAAYFICRIGGLDSLLTTVTVSVISIVPAAALFLAFLDLLRKIAAAKQQTAMTRVAEIGENDFRYGLLESSGHYYHWIRFESLMETDDCLYFVLTSQSHLRIPKTAFSAPADAQAFLTKARSCWEAALLREDQRIAPHDDTVWPPPPRLEV